MPDACDASNILTRNILRAAGIQTWSGELLQSLLLPYCLVSKAGNVNNYHHRIPAAGADLGWIWDRVLRTLTRFVFAAEFAEAEDFQWPTRDRR